MRRLFVVLLMAVLGGLIVYALVRAGPGLPPNTVLVLELGGEIEEAPAVDMLEQFFARGMALPTLILQLDKAAADERVRAVLVRIRPLAVNYARIQELRDALTRVRSSGTTVIALLDLMSLNATRELYLASSADRVYIVPGFLGPFAGVAGQVLSLGGFFEKIGVQIQYERVGRYKSAPESLAGRKLSDDARFVLSEILDGIFGQLIAGIAEGRKLELEEVRRLVDQVPSTAEEWVASGLADGIAGQAEALELEGLEDAEILSYEEYLRVDPQDLGLRNGPQIALIFGDGGLVQTGRRGPTSRIFEADAVDRALRDATEDEDVRAIVLRINSPGGSPLASDQLWRRIQEVKREKPLVVSMGDVAASAGYYVASGADAILAQPATLTGSIGVFILHPALAGLYRKLEIGSDLVTRGSYAPVAAGAEPFTESQRAKTRSFVRAAYREFLERVATGRGVSTEEVDRLGQGRVWLGEAALAHGLVDELGGLHAAVKRAQAEAGIDPAIDPERVIFPGPRPLGEQIAELMQGELSRSLLNAILPVRVPEALLSITRLVDGELAYLPEYWFEIY